jgi:hypothetical protein
MSKWTYWQDKESNELNASTSPPRPVVKQEDFDEALYLQLNPDVARAAEAKKFKSGWHHYELHGGRVG